MPNQQTNLCSHVIVVPGCLRICSLNVTLLTRSSSIVRSQGLYKPGTSFESGCDFALLLCCINYSLDRIMAKFSFPKLDARKLHLSTRVYYDRYDPRSPTSNGARKSLSHLDYSPLTRVTWPSFVMGILVSMGGFLLVNNEVKVANEC